MPVLNVICSGEPLLDSDVPQREHHCRTPRLRILLFTWADLERLEEGGLDVGR